MDRRTSGSLMLSAGAGVVVVAVLIEVWQDRNPYTIASSITLPAIVGELGGIALLALGYSRWLGDLEPAVRWRAGLIGTVLASALAVGAFVWQIRSGLPGGGNLDLDAYAAGALVFLGVAVVARGVASLAGADDEPPARTPTLRSAGLGVGCVATGVVLLALAIATVPWLDGPIRHANSLYALITIETAGAGAWLLLVGYTCAVRGLAGPALRVARILGVGAGAALVAAGGLWGSSSSRIVDSGMIAAVALVVAGVGLVALSLRRTDDPLVPLSRPRSSTD